jgi:urease accessory protein
LTDLVPLLAALQFGDGQFPGGGFAFSWGLESLMADRELARADFADFLDGQLRYRWSAFDRVIVAHAHAAAKMPMRLFDLDDLTDAFLTVETLRIGSRRAGCALLGTHLRLGTTGASAFKDAIERREAYGHLPVVQGAMLAGIGLDAVTTRAVSAYGTAQAFCTAAIRLGLIGHLDAQRALSALRPGIAALVAAPACSIDDLHTVTPVADIAAMRHADQPQRLFSN